MHIAGTSAFLLVYEEGQDVNLPLRLLGEHSPGHERQSGEKHEGCL